MLTQQKLRETLVTVLDLCLPTCAGVEYRLVGTGAASLQGVQLPTGDIDILAKDRRDVDAFGSALASFRCLFAPAWMPGANQYYACYEVDGVEVGISTVEFETESDALECVGSGPWEHYLPVPCGPHTVPAVALELRLVSELTRNRPDRFAPLIEHMKRNGCDLELVRRGMQARNLRQDMQQDVLGQLVATPAG